ncbi:MAG: bi-domain-containing oxidoreductase, partial [Candidatus Sumerlaeota bacterium]
MKQILQHLRSGKMELAELPCPRPGRGQILIRSRASLISAGTERMLVEFSQANLIQKARQQPDKVKQVLDKMKTDGIVPTLEAVFRKLDEPMPLGYCNVGTVLEVGEGVHDLSPGDRVASNGNHAEVVCVPRHLCAAIPDKVSDEAAAFTVLGSIALQGIRLAEPTLGEKFVVFGMGLLGLLTVQLLRASGCEVLAVDLNGERLALAEQFGAETVNIGSGADPVTAAEAWTGGAGVDGALITASAKTDEIMHQAAQACRKRGRIILVGVVGLNLRRDDFYKKELTFQVSCSYGPGRYDEAYEQAGRDYPLPYVRWTEQRNFQAVLGALASGRVDVEKIITHRYAFDEAVDAYDKIQNDSGALGVILNYPEAVDTSRSVTISQSNVPATNEVRVGIIGAGGFANGVLLPALSKTDARLSAIADLNGAAAGHAAKKFEIATATTDYKELLSDEAISTVFILVGHHLHSRFIIEALQAGKHVFVEKPLAMNLEELEEVCDAARTHSDRMLMVGFNRRFSPHTIEAKKALKGRGEPLTMSMTVNGGAIPADHWTQDPAVGGGRIL